MYYIMFIVRTAGFNYCIIIQLRVTRGHCACVLYRYAHAIYDTNVGAGRPLFDRR